MVSVDVCIVAVRMELDLGPLSLSSATPLTVNGRMRPLPVNGSVNGPLTVRWLPLGAWARGGTLGPKGLPAESQPLPVALADQGTDQAWPARSDGPTILSLPIGISLQLAATVGNRDGHAGLL